MDTVSPEIDQDELLQCRVCGEWLPFINHDHLKKHLMSGAEYKRKFGVDFLMSKNVRKRSAQNRRRGRKRFENYKARNRDEIIADIRKYAQLDRLRYNVLRREDGSLVSQAKWVFGSWANAVNASGLQYRKLRKWSPQDILAALAKRKENAQDLSASGIEKDDNNLYVAAGRHFGSLEAALKEVGVSYKQVKKLRSRDNATCRRDLVAWCARHGPLISKNVRDTDYNLYQTAICKYGNIKNAARKFGLPYVGQRTYWTRERVAAALRAFSLRCGPVRGNCAKAMGQSLYRATRCQFGSIRNAAQELQLPLQRMKIIWDPDRVIAKLRERMAEGQSMAVKVVQKENSTLVVAAYRHFGSWIKAMAAAESAG